MSNDVVFGVVAVELLTTHDRLDMEVSEAFRRTVFVPVLQRLRFYCDSETSDAREPPKSWRLQDRVLERQFSLGCFFSQDAATALEMFDPQAIRLPKAQLVSRQVLRDSGVAATDDPVSSTLVAWTAHAIFVGDSAVPALSSRGRPWGYAAEKPEVSQWLLPVFVEHDRSPHAERMALVSLGDVVQAAGARLHPDSDIRGQCAVYCSHTPCISCLAVFCQFRRKLPNVRLFVSFDTWGENKRWIDDAALVDLQAGPEEGSLDTDA